MVFLGIAIVTAAACILGTFAWLAFKLLRSDAPEREFAGPGFVVLSRRVGDAAGMAVEVQDSASIAHRRVGDAAPWWER